MKRKPAPPPTPYQPGEVCYEVSARDLVLVVDGKVKLWEPMVIDGENVILKGDSNV